jgi:hypothetical protein
MSNVTVDFKVEPVKAKCNKCDQEEEIPSTNGSISKFLKLMAEFEKKHKDCV